MAVLGRAGALLAHSDTFQTGDMAFLFAIDAGTVLFQEKTPLERAVFMPEPALSSVGRGVFLLVLLQDRHFRL